MNRKRLLLFFLLVLLALSVGYAFWAAPRQQRIDAVRTATRQQMTALGSGQGLAAADRQQVHFELLGEEPVPFPGASRDIFNFRQNVTAAAQPVPVPKPAPQPVVASTPPRPIHRAVETKPLAKFTFLGFLEKGDQKVVFLSSQDEIYVVGPGEHFGRNMEFEVIDISENVLTVQQAGQSTQQKVLLVEKKELASSISSPARITPSRNLPMEKIEQPQELTDETNSGGAKNPAPQEQK